MDPDVAITILFAFDVALVALGGGYLIRYELRRDHPVTEPPVAARPGSSAPLNDATRSQVDPNRLVDDELRA